MTMTDPIADLFTRIRNAGTARHKKVDIPHSILKESVARLLAREGFLREVQVSEVDDRKKIRADIDRREAKEATKRKSSGYLGW